MSIGSLERSAIRPTISIVMPCRNENEFVHSCLSSVFSFLQPEGGFEVIVVDGMSEDGTREKLRDWQARRPELKVLDNYAKNIPVAMNLGIRIARGRWIARLDMHSEYPPDYLNICLETALRTGADNVGGVFVPSARDLSFQARLVMALTTHWFGIGNAKYRLNPPKDGPADTVAFGFFPSDVFERFGMYDERLARNQDYELNCRISRSGGRIWLNPKIKVKYFNKRTIAALLRQGFFTAKWNAWTWYIAPYSFRPRHAIPGIFTTTALFLSVYSLFDLSAVYLLGLGLAAYIAGASFAALQQRTRFGSSVCAALPPAFLVYHLTYGSGILVGLLTLAFRKAPVQEAGRRGSGHH